MGKKEFAGDTPVPVTNLSSLRQWEKQPLTWDVRPPDEVDRKRLAIDPATLDLFSAVARVRAIHFMDEVALHKEGNMRLLGEKGLAGLLANGRFTLDDRHRQIRIFSLVDLRAIGNKVDATHYEKPEADRTELWVRYADRASRTSLRQSTRECRGAGLGYVAASFFLRYPLLIDSNNM